MMGSPRRAKAVIAALSAILIALIVGSVSSDTIRQWTWVAVAALFSLLGAAFVALVLVNEYRASRHRQVSRVRAVGRALHKVLDWTFFGGR